MLKGRLSVQSYDNFMNSVDSAEWANNKCKKVQAFLTILQWMLAGLLHILVLGYVNSGYVWCAHLPCQMSNVKWLAYFIYFTGMSDVTVSGIPDT